MDNATQETNRALTPEEQGVLTEIANLVADATSTTITGLIGQEVTIGQPDIIESTSVEELLASVVSDNSLIAAVQFSNGLNGDVAYFFEKPVAIQLANSMMGTQDAPDADVTDMHVNAIIETVNQMLGTAAGSISQFISKAVEVSTPNVTLFNAEELMALLPGSDASGFVSIKYPLQAGGAIPDTHIVQVSSKSHIIQQVQDLSSPATAAESVAADEEPPGGIADPMGAATESDGGASVSNPVTVQPVEFSSFDSQMPVSGELNKNLELVMDVMLNLTVELGRSELPIKDVLELTRGSIIELDKIAGEPVDLFANGKLIAKGEVVVIEDNFGLRITSIVSPEDRLRGL